MLEFVEQLFDFGFGGNKLGELDALRLREADVGSDGGHLDEEQRNQSPKSKVQSPKSEGEQRLAKPDGGFQRSKTLDFGLWTLDFQRSMIR